MVAYDSTTFNIFEILLFLSIVKNLKKKIVYSKENVIWKQKLQYKYVFSVQYYTSIRIPKSVKVNENYLLMQFLVCPEQVLLLLHPL